MINTEAPGAVTCTRAAFSDEESDKLHIQNHIMHTYRGHTCGIGLCDHFYSERIAADIQ
jgi:hypothetical protein